MISQYAKGIVAVLAFASVMVSSGVLPDHVAVWVNAVIAALSAALVILVPNAPPVPASSPLPPPPVR